MIPLAVRSHYSLMWGTAPVDRLCRHARRLGYRKLALTDTDNLCGLWPFVAACRQEGIEPVIGAELTDPETGSRAICLVKNGTGYRNLCRLITRRHTAHGFSLRSDLPALCQGLVLGTRDPGLLEVLARAGADAAALLPRTPIHGSHSLVQAARRHGLPLMAVPGSFFLDPGDLTVHRMLRAIDRNTCLDRLGPLDAAPANAFLAPPDEYRRRFATLPEAVTDTAALAERLTFRQPSFGTVMPPWNGAPGETAGERLARDAVAGAISRYGSPLPGRVEERIRYELEIIDEKNFSSYFLVVREIVRQSPRICGRGSGAASIVAYCLGITNVCPIRHNLYFERFLNPGRTDPPDIDIDFAWDERDAVLASVLKRFKGRSAMVSSHILIQPRMAVREVGRVFGLPDREIGRVSKKLPWFWKIDQAGADLLDQIRRRPQFRFMDFPEPWPSIMAHAQAIIGTPRHLSVHPGGIVITPEPIDGYVPIQTAPKGVPLMQWEKDGTETAGLVKIDLLGNRSLGVIRDAIAAVRSSRGEIDAVDGLDPESDPDTQATVAQGNTMGCFYIESPAMRLLQKKSRVGDFEHVVIHSSIIRPAANDYIREYIQRLHTGEWEPIHPLLDGVLDETYGIMVYQEDVSRVAVRMAGFSHAQADALRKVMSKKDKARALRDFHGRFRDGARERGVSDTDIETVWEMITSFSGYSFCKPHSASYARVSFQAAYLKTHFPAEFMAAVISNQGGFYSTFAYVSEARRLGLKVLPPDIRKSRREWTGNGRDLRVGLMAVSSLSTQTLERILRQRSTRPFAGLEDFLARVRPHEDEARALVHCGALDGFDPGRSRARLLWRLSAVSARRKAAASEPGDLFQESFQQPVAPPPEIPPGRAVDRLRREFSVLGFLTACHPMVLYRQSLSRRSVLRIAEIPARKGARVFTAGWLITGKIVRTKHGDPMEFLTFEDETGILETTFFPKAYERFCHLLDRGRPFLLSGCVDVDWGAVTLSVDHVSPLHLPAQTRSKLRHLPTAGKLSSA